jgi:hypothetical protein
VAEPGRWCGDDLVGATRLPLCPALISWLFARSERGAERAAVMATLIMTAKMTDVDPQAWLADVPAHVNDHAIHRLDQLLPWNWAAAKECRKVAA